MLWNTASMRSEFMGFGVELEVSRRNPESMQFDIDVIIHQALSRLGNLDLFSLSCTSSTVHSLLARLNRDNHFHFLRVCHLRIVSWSHVSWKEVHRLLASPWMGKSEPPSDIAAAETALFICAQSEQCNSDAIMATACENGYSNVVSFMLECSRSPEKHESTHLVKACEKGHAEVVRLLLEHGSYDPTVQADLCGMLAVKGGHSGVMRCLLRDGRLNPNDNLIYYLMIAGGNGHMDIVCQLLADPRCDPSQFNSWNMVHACEHGQTEVVRLLLRDGRSDIIANECVRRTWYRGHRDVLRLLLLDPRVSDDTRKAYDPDTTWSANTTANVISCCVGLIAGVTILWYSARYERSHR